MAPTEPLPFRLHVPGEEVIDLKGIRQVSYRVEGLLHLVDDILKFEWTATEKTESVSVSQIGTVVDHSPVGRHEVPAAWLTEVRLEGGWWLPRIVLRARRIDAFDGMPGARPGAIILKIQRRFRAQAAAFAAALVQSRAATQLNSHEDPTELESSEPPPLPDRGDT